VWTASSGSSDEVTVKDDIRTAGAPQAIGPYVQGVRANGLVFVSGQIPLDPATGKLVEGSIGEQTRRALENVRAILEAGGSGLASVVRTTVYLTDMAHFAAMNEVYAGYFVGSPPARSTVAVAGLPRGALVEIDAIALAS